MITSTGFGQVIANLNQPMADLTNCDAATIDAINQGLVPASLAVCAAPAAAGGGGSTPAGPGSIPNWAWIAVAAVVAVLAIRR